MKKPLLWALGLHFLLASLLIWRVPLGASPDESAHWEYVRFIAENWGLPVFRGQVPPASGYEFHQPPLFYALCAPLWAVLPGVWENYATRLVSLTCGLGTLVFLHRAAQTVFRASLIPNIAVFFAALSPIQLGLSAGANNDGLAGLLCALLFYLMARAWRYGPTRRLVWAVGAGVGLGIWTKNTTLTVSFVALLSLFFAARQRGFERPFSPFAGALLVALVLAFPLLARNQMLYGDPLGVRVFSAAARVVSPGFATFSAMGLDLFTYARGMIWMIFLTTWGFFGGPDSASRATAPLNPAGPLVRDLWLAPFLLLALIFPLLAALGLRRLPEISEKWESIWIFWGCAAVLVIAAWAHFAFNYFAGGQARYLHPAFVPFCLLFSAGFCALFRRNWKPASAAFTLFLVAISLINLLVWRTLS